MYFGPLYLRSVKCNVFLSFRNTCADIYYFNLRTNETKTRYRTYKGNETVLELYEQLCCVYYIEMFELLIRALLTVKEIVNYNLCLSDAPPPPASSTWLSPRGTVQDTEHLRSYAENSRLMSLRVMA